ncbi:MAG TPA: ABC transporter ATP-binding protein [Acidimicrobiia bacterium]|nr:ABC transporter ATP-binding protein [Acidimicrobiia bacterium]
MTGLSVEDLVVRFGGHTAVDAVSLEAPPGRITGLIGPNGAGKSTTLNACSGLVRPARGRIGLGGVDVTGRSPDARARLGLGRTFQRPELFDRMRVRTNVAIGHEGALAGGNALRHLVGRRGDRERVARHTEAALVECGLEELAERRASQLSTGDRRLVEMARTLAGDFRILLLDEPASGLDRPERRRFADVLRRAVERRAMAVLLVEHDMELVLSVCDHIYVLDFGELIFAGTPADVRRSEVVRAAYLGSTAVEEVA